MRCAELQATLWDGDFAVASCLPKLCLFARDFMCSCAALHRQDVPSLSLLVERERQMRRDEVAIDMEDRQTKKGTPPTPSEVGVIDPPAPCSMARMGGVLSILDVI